MSPDEPAGALPPDAREPLSAGPGGPLPQGELERFVRTYLYGPEAFLVDDVLSLDRERVEILARMETTRQLPLARHQRVRRGHPAHVSGGELIMVTASLGCLHAWFFHGCRWDEGWVGFGKRIHHADFKSLARLGPPLDLRSRETRARAGSRRLVLRYEFEFQQEGELVYVGDQSAIFLRDAGKRLDRLAGR